MGECATNLLLDRLSGREKGPGRRVKLDLELVTRSSTGPPPPA
jgi:DNA-binding LacI/PurR family transcriptional regulator